MHTDTEIRHDRVIWELINDRMKWVQDPSGFPDSFNFVIVSHHGRYDWSGFRTLQGCEEQIPALEGKHRPDGYYRVVERR